MNYIIKDATIVNEGTIKVSSVHIKDGRIAAVDNWKKLDFEGAEIIEAEGRYLIPGVIDTHVHFREPGMTEKADMATESRAAAVGGVTSIIDMPNTTPQTTSMAALEAKKKLAADHCMVNYGFMLGATNENIDDLLATDPSQYAAIKLFLGSSTGNMLVNDEERLDHLFSASKKLIVAHCEEEHIVQDNLHLYKVECQGTPRENASLHPKIRNTEACFVSTYKAIERARRYGTRFHVAHISTATELDLLSNLDMSQKNITAEVTPNHLWFDDRDYEKLGNQIKCNPAIKSNDDRLALWAALYDGLIDTIATDHAPHTWESKQKPYFEAPSGIPSIQHSLQMMLETFFNPTSKDDKDLVKTWLPLIITKMCHAPADLFGIKERGYIREGYHADLVLIDPSRTTEVTTESLKYKCGWSPLTGNTFHSHIDSTWINGNLVWNGTEILESKAAQALEF